MCSCHISTGQQWFGWQGGETQVMTLCWHNFILQWNASCEKTTWRGMRLVFRRQVGQARLRHVWNVKLMRIKSWVITTQPDALWVAYGKYPLHVEIWSPSLRWQKMCFNMVKHKYPTSPLNSRGFPGHWITRHILVCPRVNTPTSNFSLLMLREPPFKRDNGLLCFHFSDHLNFGDSDVWQLSDDLPWDTG